MTEVWPVVCLLFLATVLAWELIVKPFLYLLWKFIMAFAREL
jgi:hypothetical protein